MDPLNTDVGIGEGRGQVQHVGVGRLWAIHKLYPQYFRTLLTTTLTNLSVNSLCTYSIIHPLVVHVSSVMFWTQSACMIPK